MICAIAGSGCADTQPECAQNLYRIGRALHDFHDDRSSFPKAAISDKNGRPGLSWRVAILPLLGETELYEKFKLDEPWDSPRNAALLPEMPAVFACPGASGKDRSLTVYRAFVGPGAFMEKPFDAKTAKVWWTGDDGVKHYFTEPPNGLSLAAFMDGPANTIMLVEAADAVPWTKPEGLDFDTKVIAKSPRGAGSPHRGGFNALFVNGAVRFLKSATDPATFHHLITRNGGEFVDPDKL